jgi:DNA polymerase-4
MTTGEGIRQGVSVVNWSQAVLHLDMDAFFVNVHRLEHPEDVGIPLAVGGQPEHRGVIASASYEARQFGIRSAMPSKTALRLCPQLKIVGHNWSPISEYSRKVMAILKEYGSVEQISVDEAYVDLSDAGDPTQLAFEIRQRVKGETKLPTSVGLSKSKLVAKVASDHDKPEGCTIVLPGQEAAFLAPQPVRVIPGIGPKTAEKLSGLEIETCGDLAAKDLSTLQKYFGSHAESLQRRAMGIDKRRVATERGQRKSISHERTFSQDVADPETLQETLRDMATWIAKSLKKRNMVAHTVRVKFRWADFTTFTRQMSFTVGTDDEVQIYRAGLALFKKQWRVGRKIRLIGLGVSGLEKPEVRQFDFGF